MRNHFIDSLSCTLSPVIAPHICLLDIGTGAGFPAIPLKIYSPDMHVVAVDAVAKKVMFLRHICRLLDLQDVECLATRLVPVSSSSYQTSKSIQQVSPLRSRTFDVVVSRAVGAVPYLVELARPFLTSGSHILLQRGKYGEQELAENMNLLEENGLQVLDMIKVPFSFYDAPRYLMILRWPGER